MTIARKLEDQGMADGHEDIHVEAGRRLATARRSQGVSQEGLAELLGVAPETVSRYENAARHMSLDVIHRVAEVLHVPLSDLIPGLRHYENGDQEVELMDLWRRLDAGHREAMMVVLRGLTEG